jgi:hypothetical protein
MIVAKGYMFENDCRLAICASLFINYIIQLSEKQGIARFYAGKFRQLTCITDIV